MARVRESKTKGLRKTLGDFSTGFDLLFVRLIMGLPFKILIKGCDFLITNDYCLFNEVLGDKCLTGKDYKLGNRTGILGDRCFIGNDG